MTDFLYFFFGLGVMIVFAFFFNDCSTIKSKMIFSGKWLLAAVFILVVVGVFALLLSGIGVLARNHLRGFICFCWVIFVCSLGYYHYRKR
jgi:hypothetical protein